MPTHVDRYHMYWDTVLQQICTVIKMGKKYEKLFFGAKKDTVRNFRNSNSENKPLFEIYGNILKLFLATVFGVRIFRVFKALGKLPYFQFCGLMIIRQLSIHRQLQHTAKHFCCIMTGFVLW